jgi:N-acetylmuramoyl-L-alanine amidase
MNREKLKIVFSLFVLLIFSTATLADAKEEALPRISVVYPLEGARIGASDSTFIFGSVTPKSKLTINGFETEVHPNGAFLSFLPLTSGDFVFELLAENSAGVSVKRVPVRVPLGIFPVPEDSFCIVKGSIRPRQNFTLTPGDVLETKFRGTPGCRASFSIEGLVEEVPMIESVQSTSTFPQEHAWGERKRSRPSPVSGTYTGLYMVRSADKAEEARVLFKLIKRLGEDSVYITESSRGKITIADDQIPQVVEFVGSSVVARSGPKLGYTLLYQPPGIRAVTSGKKGEWVRLRLAPGEDAWVHQDSIKYLPLGTPIPKSILTTIETKRLEGRTQVTLLLQEKLPFKVEQQTGPSALFLTVYGVTSNTDWIRYDSQDRLIREIGWDQPKKNVYQLKVFLNQKQQWGYDVFYHGNNLILIAKKLKKILVRNGAEVVMTRRGMEGVALYDRPRIAIEKGCDILISIHNNALPDGVNPFYNNGTSTYYYHPQSLPLAKEIQSEQLKRLKLPDFGTYYGNLVLTRPSQLPAVLVESAFMMIPEQEALLRTDKFQKKCAQAIARGVLNFVKSAKE